MIKVPGTAAGVWVLEELAALGIPTNPTVLTTLPQVVTCAQAYERGAARAKKAGIKPAWSTAALVIGRLYDHLIDQNRDSGAGFSPEDLQWATLELMKRAYQIFETNNFKTVIMGAAFRSAFQVEQLAGGKFCSTIHPKIQQMVEDADAAGTLRREICIGKPVDPKIIAKVSNAFPDYARALDPGGIKESEFDSFPAVVKTLDNFHINGWQKLKTLKKLVKRRCYMV